MSKNYKIGSKFRVTSNSTNGFNVGEIVNLVARRVDGLFEMDNGEFQQALYEDQFELVCEPLSQKLKPAKQALADAINQNGGWPERALWAAQDNCIAFFLGGKPEYKPGDRCWYSNSIDGACVGTIACYEKVTNWHQTILSREEYYQAYPMTDDDGWIEWCGGECPVYGDDKVDVVLVGGSTNHGIADEFDWHRDGGTLSVASYRLHKPEVKPEFCESVTHGIPEPESIDGLCAKVTEENKHQHVDAKPTIEKLAQDYRNKLDFAKRKQQEADDAKAAADAALGELERAGEALGLLIGIAKPDQEPELVITDWRDLKVGDVIWVEGVNKQEVGEQVVVDIEGVDYKGMWAINTNLGWLNLEVEEWRFIRRP